MIGALPTAAAGVMPAVIARLRKDYPGISVRVIEDRYEEQIGSLTLGDIDLVVGRLYPPIHNEHNIVRTELYDEALSVIVGSNHPLASLGEVPAAMLAAYEVSLPIATLRIHAETQVYLECYGVIVSEGTTTTSLTLLRELLISSDLVTVMPRLMLAGDIDRGTLRVVPLVGGPSPRRPAGLMHRADRPLMPAAQTVCRLIAQHAEEMQARTEA